jgi:methylmalonyl-CoA mutase
MEHLFDEFESKTLRQWQEKIISDLKGKDFNYLKWKSPSGIEVSPIYNRESISKHTGELTHIHSDWQIEQTLETPHNKEVLDCLNNGANALLIKDCPPKQIEKVLKDVLIQYIEISFSSKSIENILEEFILLVQKRNLLSDEIRGCLQYDPLMDGLKNGQFDPKIWQKFKTIQNKSNLLIGFRVLSIQAHEYHNFGANICQELAFAIAQLSEYLSQEDTISSKNIQISLGISTNYFFEIAKFRAIRLLAKQVFAAYEREDSPLQIRAETGLRSSTMYDTHVNLLRATSQSMSAALGGANILNVNNFNQAIKRKDAHAERLGRNISLILKDESYFNKVSDPSAGSYYIEYLTDELCHQAWKLFQKIEEKGGWMKAIKEDFIQKEILKNAEQQTTHFQSGESSLLGTNLFPNEKEKIVAEVENRSGEKHTKGIEFISLHSKRLSSKMELERLNNQNKDV